MSLWKKTTDCLSRNNIAQLSRLGDLANRQHRLRLEPLEDRRMLSVLHVDADALAGGDGLAWGSAYDDLQLALDRAEVLNADEIETNDIDQIWIAEGAYLPTKRLEPENERSAAFSLLDHVALYGGFEGNEAALDQRDWATHETILSGDLGIQADTSDNAYTVVYSGENIKATLDGISITGGSAHGSIYYPEQMRGGGIFNAGDLKVINSTISGNSADREGGGVYSNLGNFSISNSTISDNSSWLGGGVYQLAGNLTVTSTTISDNSARDYGGGIYCCVGSMLNVMDSNISGNAAGFGGGIYGQDDCSASVDNSIISDNSATISGGGMNFVSFGSLIVSNSTISGNSATYDGGGGIYAECGDFTLTNSTVSGNFSIQGDGGGIDQSQGVLLVTNTTISANSASNRGGGISSDSSETVFIDKSIISDNVSDGIYLGNAFNATIRDTQISGNSWVGIKNCRSNLTVTDSTVSNNAKGGIYSYGDLMVTNSTISSNKLDDNQGGPGITIIGTATIEGSIIFDHFNSYDDGNGGGLLLESGECSIANTLFSGNFAKDCGGGIYLRAGTLTVSDSTFLDNTAVRDGGAIYSQGNGEFFVSGSTFEGNYADAGGGAIYNWLGGTGTVVDSTFTKNTSGGHGGALANTGTLHLSGLTVSGNTTTGEGVCVMGGGGISNQNVMTIANSTIVGNHGAKGGGIYTYGELTLTSTTVSGNTAENGGGIYNRHNSPYSTCILSLQNSIISLNETSSGTEISGIVTSLNSCLLGSDPKFIRNPSDGGDGWGDDPSTPEIDEGANDDYGDLRLRPYSPAVDAGNNTLAVDATGNPLLTDMVGNPRIQNETIDIGAFEQIPLLMGDVNEDGNVNASDFAYFMSNWQYGTANWPGGDPVLSPTGSVAGDLDEDGTVSATDFAYFMSNWQGSMLKVSTPVDDLTLSEGDPQPEPIDLYEVFNLNASLYYDDQLDSSLVLNYSVESSNPELVMAEVIDGRWLQLTYLPYSEGQDRTPAVITVTGGVSLMGGPVSASDQFTVNVELPVTVPLSMVASQAAPMTAADWTLDNEVIMSLALDLHQHQSTAKKSDEQELKQEKLWAAAYADYE